MADESEAAKSIESEVTHDELSQLDWQVREM